LHLIKCRGIQDAKKEAQDQLDEANRALADVQARKHSAELDIAAQKKLKKRIQERLQAIKKESPDCIENDDVDSLKAEKQSLMDEMKTAACAIKTKMIECGSIDIELRVISDRILALQSQIAEHDTNIAIATASGLIVSDP